MSLPNEEMVEKNYNLLYDGKSGIAAKMWNKHVKIEEQALKQILETASMPFVKPYVAVMPDAHYGMGATVGSVVPTIGAVMPSCVGVDIGCGMMAVRTNLKWFEEHEDTKLNSQAVFDAISKAVPHGRTDNGGANDIGAWPADAVPEDIMAIWEREFLSPFLRLSQSHPGAISKNSDRHLGTLGTGNHFIEVCTEIDNPDSNLWVVIHSGSRGLGNRIGTYFTKLAGDLCKTWSIQLPNRDLGYLPISTQEYKDYIDAVLLAQNFAWKNREIMMERVLDAIGAEKDTQTFRPVSGQHVPTVIHMHHNYAQATKDGVLTRKGAVDASKGKWVIIPGSMGAKTYLGIGLGNKDSFNSCSHGAGRAMSRTQALKQFTVGDHEKATEGVYCDKTRAVLDETPAAYKSIDDVMESQKDLVEPVLKIKQLVCVKGLSD